MILAIDILLNSYKRYIIAYIFNNYISTKGINPMHKDI